MYKVTVRKGSDVVEYVYETMFEAFEARNDFREMGYTVTVTKA